MPLTVSGDLKIVAAADLGGLGADLSQPVAVHFRHVPNLSWLVILMALVLPANRTVKAWLILIPALLVMGGGTVVRSRTAMDSESAIVLGQTCAMLSVTLAAFLLLAPVVSGTRGWTRVGSYLGILAIVMAAAFMSDPHTGASLAVTVLCLVPITVATRIARRLVHGHLTLARFVAWFTAGLIPGTFLVVLAYRLVICLVPGAAPLSLGDVVRTLIAVPIFSFALCVVVLPFIVLSFSSAFWRKRLEGMLGFGTSPCAPQTAGGTETPAPDR